MCLLLSVQKTNQPSQKAMDGMTGQLDLTHRGVYYYC